MKQILTDRSALAIHPTTYGVMVEQHSWLTRRSARKPDAVNVACFDEDELRPLGEALIAEAERREAERR